VGFRDLHFQLQYGHCPLSDIEHISLVAGFLEEAWVMTDEDIV